MRCALYLLTGLLLCQTGLAFAIDDILVVGLFKNKAVVLIDNKRRLLSIGEVSPEGVQLIRADSRSATLEIQGQRRKYMLGSRVKTTYANPQYAKTTIYRNTQGMYVTSGSINGQVVTFLVDTGASAIAMNKNTARRLAIDYEKKEALTVVNTASGMSRAYQVTLKQVKLGALSKRNVTALVIDGDAPQQVLLGMSFLGGLDIKNTGQMMVLEKKY